MLKELYEGRTLKECTITMLSLGAISDQIGKHISKQNIGIQMENHSGVMELKCLYINEGPKKSKLITVDEAGIQKKNDFHLFHIFL